MFTLHRSSTRRGASHIALVVVLVLILVSAAVGAWYFIFRGSSLPEDLQLVSHDSAAFVTVRCDDVWKNEDVQKLMKELPGAKSPEKDFETHVGLKPADVERVTFVFPSYEQDESKQQLLAILLTKTPLDQEKLKKHLSTTKEEKVKEKKFYVNDGQKMAIHFAGEKIAVIGTGESVKKYLGQEIKTEGPLTDALKRAAGEHHFVAGFTITDTMRADAKKAGEEGSQAEVKALLPLMELKSATLVVDLKKELEASLFADYPDEKKAKAAKDAIQGAIEYAKGMAKPEQKPLIGSTLKELKPEQTGTELKLTLKVKDVVEKVKQLMPKPEAAGENKK